MSKASAPKLNIFVPLTKVDEENRLVYGLVAEEIKDRSGETMDYASSKLNFQKWSDEVHTASGGLSKGNLRGMHGKVAAGKLVDLTFDDENRRIECCSKVVDDNEWKKVLEGVYTGFSMGGRYEKRWDLEKGDGTKEKRYTALPSEVSLVDTPCIPTAMFYEVIKADGSSEMRKFLTADDDQNEDNLAKGGASMPGFNPTNDQILPVAQELAKAAGKPETSWLDFVVPATETLKKAFEAKEKGDKAEEEADPAAEAKEGEEKPAGGGEPTDEGAEAEETTEGNKGDVLDEEEREEAIKSEDGADDETAPAAEDDDKGEKSEKEDKAEKADFPELQQGWQAKDGKFFAKKADALAHNDSLEKAADIDPDSLAGKLAKMAEQVAAIGADGDKDETDGTEEEVPEIAKSLNAYADLLSHPETLKKGLYEVSRMADVLRSTASLTICLASEAVREGDNSPLPAKMEGIVGELSAALIELAQEETSELLAGMASARAKAEATEGAGASYLYPDGYMALAAPILGLEKAQLEEMGNNVLAKRAPVEPTGDMGEKLASLEKMLEETNDKLAKRDAEIATAMPMLEKMQKEIERINALPMPSAPITNAVDKSADVSGLSKAEDFRGVNDVATAANLMTKFAPDTLVDAAIRMAQTQGRPLIDR